MPKRLLLLHLHHTEALPLSKNPAAAAVDADISAAAHVQSRVVDSQWAFAGTDSTPVAALLRAMRLPLARARRQPAGGSEWSSIYPISELIDVRLMPTKALSPPPVGVLPYIRLVSEDTGVLTATDGGGAYRDVHFDVYTEAPCWGLLNVTAPGGVLSWSLTPQKWRPGGAAPRNLVVRWTSQRWRTPWRVSVRVAAGAGADGGGKLRVQLHVDYLAETPALAAMKKRLPEWGTMTYEATCYISDWRL
jgi:hypothetical protein